MMIRYIVLALLLLPGVEALSCAQMTIEQQLDQGAIMFTGKLIEQHVEENEEVMTNSAMRAFEIQTLFRGDLEDTVSLKQVCWTGCEELPLQSYFVIAYENDNQLTIGMCEHPIPIERAATQIQMAAAYINQGSHEEPVQSPENPTLPEDQQNTSLNVSAYFVGGLVVLLCLGLFIIWRRR